MLPPRITTMRSERVMASSWSWVTIDAGDAQSSLQASDLSPHLHAQLRVEVRERLVEEQHLGLHDQGARERDPLLLSARELVRCASLQRREVHRGRARSTSACDLACEAP